MIKFELVTFNEFKKQINKFFPSLSDFEIEDLYSDIQLPKRGSKGSAGYDIYSPLSFNLSAPNSLIPSIFGGAIQKTIIIPLGIKAQMPKDIFLEVVPRSGIGFKTGVCLANTVGIIDSDYYNNESNEGHIMLKFESGFSDLVVNKGDRIAQGIFLKYYTVDDDNIENNRQGGFGSTGTN